MNHAHTIFAGITRPNVLTANITNIRSEGEQLGNHVSIWPNLNIICKDTEQKAATSGTTG